MERTCKELRGEKIKDESKPVGGSPPLSEVILKVLADNGKNFTGLAEGERITVVVTFRDDGVYQPQPGGVPGMPSPGGSSGSQRMPLPGGSGGLSPFINPTPAGMLSPGYKPPEPAKDEAAWMTDVRNSLTLGDLHVKQQNIAAAIAAYNKAQEQLEKGLNAEKDAGRVLTAAHLCLHLARGYDSAGDNTSARKATQKVGSLARMAACADRRSPRREMPPVMTPPTLPGKLIVTASKKLLDEVGYGKMTFEAFSKAATVEYVKPSRRTRSETDQRLCETGGFSGPFRTASNGKRLHLYIGRRFPQSIHRRRHAVPHGQTPPTPPPTPRPRRIPPAAPSRNRRRRPPPARFLFHRVDHLADAAILPSVLAMKC